MILEKHQPHCEEEGWCSSDGVVQWLELWQLTPVTLVLLLASQLVHFLFFVHAHLQLEAWSSVLLIGMAYAIPTSSLKWLDCPVMHLLPQDKGGFLVAVEALTRYCQYHIDRLLPVHN